MKCTDNRRKNLCLLLAFVLLIGILSSCAASVGEEVFPDETEGAEEPAFLVVIEDEPDTVDFQCTTIHYAIAQNCFDRLVGMERSGDGSALIVPELAERWEVSDDHCVYTFHLRPGVKFSNGSPLTAEDVRYTFTRVLTHPDSNNQDIASDIVGAERLMRGETAELEGFRVLGELDFSITLAQPFEAFLACLSMPAASILDAETTEQAGERFGREPEWTVGTGSFILQSWEPGRGMTLVANAGCWRGAPACDGVEELFLTDAEEVQSMFDAGELDILCLDDIGKASEFYLHGDIYQDRLYQVQRISITYFALNESKPILEDVRVRKALQLALNRTVLLDAAYSGNGWLENGIMPHGLSGYNPELPEIPYDPDTARALLQEAGYPDGFSLTISVSAASTLSEMALIRAAASMWEAIGIKTDIEVLPNSEFMTLRKSGELSCYSATWTADFNDPDNFFYTFFGSAEKTRFRSLCYSNEDVMERVRLARAIADPDARLEEYRELERQIVQEDAAWIPLFTRLRYYVGSERLRGITSSWNGSVKNEYRQMYIAQDSEGGTS